MESTEKSSRCVARRTELYLISLRGDTFLRNGAHEDTWKVGRLFETGISGSPSYPSSSLSPHPHRNSKKETVKLLLDMDGWWSSSGFLLKLQKIPVELGLPMRGSPFSTDQALERKELEQQGHKAAASQTSFLGSKIVTQRLS